MIANSQNKTMTAEAKKLKNKYETILQQNNGYGWDDVEIWETNSTFSGMSNKDKAEMKRLKSEYKIAQPRSPLRVINRKTPLK